MNKFCQVFYGLSGYFSRKTQYITYLEEIKKQSHV